MISRRPLMFLLLAALAIPALAPAQMEPCVDYGDYLHWVLRQPTPDDAVGITLEGERLYVSCQSAGVAIYDVSEPGAPVHLGTADTPCAAIETIVDGDLAYVADWWNPGFCVVDVSDPTAPEVLGSCGAGSNPYVWDLTLVKPDTVYVMDP